MASTALVEELSVAPHGSVLAAKVWGNADGPSLLCLHGWRDNAGTFERLAPLLAQHFRVIALDFPGHGKSAPRHRDGTYEIWTYVEEVVSLLDALNLHCVDVVGHSMGGAVACLFAAAFPERIKRLVMLDSLGPLSVAPIDAPAQLRKSLLQKRDWSPHERSYYTSREAAITARARVGLTFESAAFLADRNVGQDEKGWYWQSDRRLARANPLSLSEAHVEAFLRQIQCPAQLVKAVGGNYWDKHSATYAARVACFKHLEVVELPGHHHQHLEGQVAEVAQAVRNFLA